MKAIIYLDDKGEKFEYQDIPKDLLSSAVKYREKMLEKLAEFDDEILDAYIHSKEISVEKLNQAIRTNTIEDCYIQAIYNSRRIANIHLSWVNPLRRRYIEVVGTKRTLVGDCVSQKATIYDGDEWKKLDIVPNNTIREEILNFVKAVESGKNEPNSGIVGMRSIEMINKAEESVKVCVELPRDL